MRTHHISVMVERRMRKMSFSSWGFDNGGGRNTGETGWRFHLHHRRVTLLSREAPQLHATGLRKRTRLFDAPVRRFTRVSQRKRLHVQPVFVARANSWINVYPHITRRNRWSIYDYSSRRRVRDFSRLFVNAVNVRTRRGWHVRQSAGTGNC